MDDSAIMCDEIIELYDDDTIFNERKATCKTQKFLCFTGILINYYNITDSC